MFAVVAHSAPFVRAKESSVTFTLKNALHMHGREKPRILSLQHGVPVVQVYTAQPCA